MFVPRTEIFYYDLHGTKYCTYHDEFEEYYDDVWLHPTYESKVMRYAREYFPEVLNEKTLFWIVGSKPIIERMHVPELGPIPTKLEVFHGE